MESTAVDLCVPFEPAFPPRGGEALAKEVHSLLSRLRPTATYERRRFERYGLPFLLQLTPLDGQRRPMEGEERVVVGKDLSKCGIGFFHEEPLVCRRAIVMIDEPELGQFTVEIDITWCRFTKLGWYESGGRLIRAVATTPSPAAQAG